MNALRYCERCHQAHAARRPALPCAVSWCWGNPAVRAAEAAAIEAAADDNDRDADAYERRQERS